MSKILYWPGMGQDLEILKKFREELVNQGNNVYTIDFKYDDNVLNPNKWSAIEKNKFDWWIGLSLGASLLYYSYEFVPEKIRPKRITIINPFSSRKILAKERNFSLDKQWDFSPINSKMKVNTIDLVRSIQDDKIPSHHGFELLNNAIANEKNLILINESHTIDNYNAQVELAKLSINKESRSEQYYYCNIFKQC